MKNIFMFARDPGSANVIIALLTRVSEENNVILYGKDVASKVFSRNRLKYVDIASVLSDISITSICELLIKYNIDLVITGATGDDFTERYLWKAARMLGIKSFAILDQWVNYGFRFSEYINATDMDKYINDHRNVYLPDKILVMDLYCKEQLIKENIEEERIIVTGQPHFEKFVSDLKSISPDVIKNYSNRISIQKDELVIVFVSEPIIDLYGMDYGTNHFGYNEEVIFNYLYNCLVKLTERYNKSVRMIIRPHPKEKNDKWINRMKNTKRIKCVLDSTTDSKLIIKVADLICGMSSMFLIESAICKKKIISIQIGLKIENPLILEKKGVLKTIRDTIELEKQLICVFENRMNECNMKICEHAVENIVNLI